MNLLIHIDGGSRGNPGPAAAGVVVQDADDLTILHEAGYFLGRNTNNVAEYHGLIQALKIAAQFNAGHIEIRSDSELMVRQINRQYKVKSPDLLPLFEQAQILLPQHGSWSMVHVRRHLNARADELANLALDAGRTIVVESAADFPARDSKLPPPPSIIKADHRTVSAGASDKPFQTSATSAPLENMPRWTLQFDTSPGLQCPYPCQSGKVYRLSPATPAGLCIYAAAQAIEQGPLNRLDPQQKIRQIRCSHCGAQMTLKRVK